MRDDYDKHRARSPGAVGQGDAPELAERLRDTGRPAASVLFHNEPAGGPYPKAYPWTAAELFPALRRSPPEAFRVGGRFLPEGLTKKATKDEGVRRAELAHRKACQRWRERCEAPREGRRQARARLPARPVAEGNHLRAVPREGSGGRGRPPGVRPEPRARPEGRERLRGGLGALGGATRRAPRGRRGGPGSDPEGGPPLVLVTDVSSEDLAGRAEALLETFPALQEPEALGDVAALVDQARGSRALLLVAMVLVGPGESDPRRLAELPPLAAEVARGP